MSSELSIRRFAAEMELLLQSELPDVTLNLQACRRSHIASLVYSALTRDGADVGFLAPFFLEGGGAAYDALVSYVFAYDEPEVSSTFLPLKRFDSTPSLEVFIATCLLPNAPATFPVDMREGVLATAASWVTREGEIDVDAFAAFFAEDARVAVADCSQPDQPRQCMSLRDFAARLQRGEAQSLYLRDLHLVAAAKVSFDYLGPKLFEMDWPALCFDCGMRNAADLRFVYCGGNATSTPTHCDVMNTYSWSISLCGKKRWQLWPPHDTTKLYDVFGHRLAPWPRSEATSPLMWPRARDAPCLEFWQFPGEAVFVPSGWRHNVVNESDTGILSVNANWFNAFNCHWVCHHVMEELRGDHGSEARERVASMLRFVIQQTRTREDLHDSKLLAAFTIRRCEQALKLLGA